MNDPEAFVAKLNASAEEGQIESKENPAAEETSSKRGNSTYRTRIVLLLVALAVLAVLVVALYHTVGRRNEGFVQQDLNPLLCKGDGCTEIRKGTTKALYLIDSSHVHYSHTPPYGALDSNVKRGSQFFYNGFAVWGVLKEDAKGLSASRGCFVSPISALEKNASRGSQGPSETTVGWGGFGAVGLPGGYGAIAGSLVGEFYLRAEVLQRGPGDASSREWIRTLYGACPEEPGPNETPSETMRRLLEEDETMEGCSIMNVDLDLDVYPSDESQIGSSHSWISSSFVYRAHAPFPDSWFDVQVRAGGKSRTEGNAWPSWSVAGPAIFGYLGHAFSKHHVQNDERATSFGSLRPLGGVHVLIPDQALLDKIFPESPSSARLDSYKMKKISKFF